MPHVAITMIPGRDDKTKQALALKTQAFLVQELGIDPKFVSIPMPVASFLEEYDFSGKTIIPFCSHGGGRFGQSLTAITKLAPDAVLGEGLAVSYSGGSGLADDVAVWLAENDIS